MKIQDDLDLHLKEEASRIIGEEAENGIEFTIKVPASRKPLILHSSPCLRHGIEFAIVVPATQKRLLLLLRIHYVHGGEFARLR